jgi:hypothetical protein
MTGRRRPDETEPHLLEPGDSCRYKGLWWCQTPPNAQGASFLGDLSKHTVTEHEDGTITVAPSILVTAGRNEQEVWHGFLEKGIWGSV